VELRGQVALVTGGASGIGRAIALALAREGCSLAIADVARDRLAATAEEIRAAGVDAQGFSCDVGSEADVMAMRDYAFARFGRVDLLVNNAGVALGGSLPAIPAEEWERLLRVNVLGAVHGLRAFLPAMLARGAGWIAATASSLALFPDDPHAVPYVTSKFALAGMCRSMALYLKPRGVGVTLFCPGPVDTDFPRNARTIARDGRIVPTPPSALEGGLSPSEAARVFVEGLRAGRFLVTTVPGVPERMAADAADLDAALERALAALPPRG